MIRSKYTYDIQCNTIFIEDIGEQEKSVTNDIENVLEDIRTERNISLEKYKILYRDSMGIIDGVKTINGKFDDFHPIQELDIKIAESKMLSEVEEKSFNNTKEFLKLAWCIDGEVKFRQFNKIKVGDEMVTTAVWELNDSKKLKFYVMIGQVINN